MRTIICLLAFLLILILPSCLCSVEPFYAELGIRDLEDNDLLNFKSSSSFNRDSILFYYFENGVKKNVGIDYSVKDTALYNTSMENYLILWELDELVIRRGITTFYLYLNKNTIDTFTIKAHKSGRCVNEHKIDEFKINAINCLNQPNPVIINNRKYGVHIN